MLAVHWLADDDRGLAELFGGETGDEVDKFERCPWQAGPAGVPVLEGVKGWVAGPVRRPVRRRRPRGLPHRRGGGCRPRTGSDELGFQAVKDIEPGHEA